MGPFFLVVLHGVMKKTLLVTARGQLCQVTGLLRGIYASSLGNGSYGFYVVVRGCMCIYIYRNLCLFFGELCQGLSV